MFHIRALTDQAFRHLLYIIQQRWHVNVSWLSSYQQSFARQSFQMTSGASTRAFSHLCILQLIQQRQYIAPSKLSLASFTQISSTFASRNRIKLDLPFTHNPEKTSYFRCLSIQFPLSHRGPVKLLHRTPKKNNLGFYTSV